ncbi:hypothetical protein Q9966_011133 [Columba livia]|nr:hypothetical protein Q9966_011133 [Columba livia]
MFSSGVTYILAVVKGNLRPGTEALKSPLEHLFSNQLRHTTPGIANTLLDKIQVTIGLNLKENKSSFFQRQKRKAEHTNLFNINQCHLPVKRL